MTIDDDGSVGWSTSVEPFEGTPEYSYRRAVWEAGFSQKIAIGPMRAPAQALVVARLSVRTSVKHVRCLGVAFEVVDLSYIDDATNKSTVSPALRSPASRGEIGGYLGQHLFGLALGDLGARNYWLPYCTYCAAEFDVDPENLVDCPETALRLPPLAELLRARRTLMLPAKRSRM